MRNFVRLFIVSVALFIGAGAASAASLQEVLQDSMENVKLYEHKTALGMRVYQVADIDMTVQFTLDAEGAVTNMKVVKSTADDREVNTNVKRALTTALNKAALKNAAGTYNIPLHFEGSRELPMGLGMAMTPMGQAHLR